MSGISLSYCQLIKIILSQIGGNPLQQVYTQLSQGARQVTAGTGIIPEGLSEVKTVIDQITTAINTVNGVVATAQDTMEKVAGQLYQNPMAAPIAAAIAAIDAKLNPINARIAVIDANPPGTTPTSPYTTLAEEKTDLVSQKTSLDETRAKLVQYKTNTDRLSGVATLSGSEAGGGCSLQDLLGSGCTPNEAVPDVDIKQLIDSIKQGDLVNALALKIQNATGYTDYQVALSSLKTTVGNFVDAFNNAVNKAAIRNAVTAQVTQIVFNLLSGCSGEVFDLTLKPDIKAAVTGYLTVLQNQASGNAYVDSTGATVTVTETTIAPTVTLT